MTIAAAVLVIYFAQEVLIPLALSFLLTFLLAPLATRLERRGVNRIAAVIAVVAVAFGIIGGIGWIVGKQVVSLAEDLPTYQKEIVRKVEAISGSGGKLGANFEKLGDAVSKATRTPAEQPTSGPASKPADGLAEAAAKQIAADPLEAVGREAAGVRPETRPSAPIGTSAANPFYAVALPAPVSPIKTLGTYLGLVLGPMGNAGLVIVFVIFMLLEREDLRDRLIRLASGGKYTVTTKALDDAGGRIGRYILAQSIVNGSYGVIIGLGLFVIGLLFGRDASGNYVPFPSFVLWGLLCATLRFIPYVGPFAASAFPLALALAVYPGFTVFAVTLGWILFIELLSNNVMEPWLYGASTGLSTMAIMVAAVFWTWVWGPIGLLLSTPLTVCIVVIGKYVRPLKFLDVMLGDRPALAPGVRYYQRLLAGDKVEATAVATEVAEEHGPERVADDVLLPALRLARRDRRDEDLTADQELAVFEATGEVIEAFSPGGDRYVAAKEKLAERAEKERVAKEKAAAKAGAATDPAHAFPVKVISNGDATSPKQTPDPASTASPDAPAGKLPLVIACAAHHRSEELAARMVVAGFDPAAFRTDVTSTRLLPVEIEARIAQDGPAAVVIAVMPPGGVVQARYLCRRLRRRFPDLAILVAYFGKARHFDRLLVRFRTAGATYVTTSAAQTRSQVQAVLSTPAGAAAPTGRAAEASAAKFVDRKTPRKQ